MPKPLPSIPGYDVETLLNAGTFGAVYRVQDKASRQLFAAKVYHQRCDAAKGLPAAFVREAEITKQWNHPNLVRSVSSGCIPDDESTLTPYLVMEWIDGAPLDKLEFPLGIGAAFDIVLDAAHGLAEAARHRPTKDGVPVIHRDIKPGNIMLRRANAVAVVVDFGLARSLEPAWRQESIQPPGSVSYSSPHQYNRAAEANEGDDVYSLGCVFYYLLTHEHAFRIDPHTQGTVGALRDRVDHGQYTPLEKLRGDVPEEIRALVERMMACDRDGHKHYPTWTSFFDHALLLMHHSARRRPNNLYPDGLHELRISEYQALFHRIYSLINGTRSTDQIMLRLVSSGGHLGKLLKDAEDWIGTPRMADVRSELVSMFVWLLALANNTGIDLETAVWLKFPGACTYCLGKHTDAPADEACRNRDRGIYPSTLLRMAEQSLRDRPRRLLDWEMMLESIYPTTFGKGSELLIEKLAEEIGEVADAITRPAHRLDRLRSTHVDTLAFEMADLFAWICHCSHFVRVKTKGSNSVIAAELAIQFHNEVCRVCRRAPCSCEPERSSRVFGDGSRNG